MPAISHDEFTRRVEQGEALFIYDSKVYRVDGFINRHPGGRLAIWHMLGRDATSEIRVLHPDWVIARMLPAFCIGQYTRDVDSGVDKAVQGLSSNQKVLSEPGKAIEKGSATGAKWSPSLSHVRPSHDSLASVQDYTTRTVNRQIAQLEKTVEPETLPMDYDAIEADFRRLELQVKKLGLENTNYWCYAKESVRYVLFFLGAFVLSMWGPEHWLNYTISALCCGLLWQQLSFTVHDLGHNGVTHKLWWDGLMGVLIADFVGGLSVGWWKKNHNVHHIITNDPEHDPDIQHLPFFAVTTKLFHNMRSSYYGRQLQFDRFAQFLIPFQHLLYIPILCFGRFNLYFQSLSHLLTADFAPWRWLELTGIAVFWIWYITFLSHFPSWRWALFHALLSHMFTVILHLQITLSHFGMSTTCPDPERECFAARQLRTTMDIDCPAWFDWFHGGLQFQVEHHLFPQAPRHNLRQIQVLVKDFAARHPGLKFYSFDFFYGIELVLDSMKSVGEQVQTWVHMRLVTLQEPGGKA
ncbi:hypothetical protein IWQ61_003784 [Dispira simplex]|nr:hypothetical protein IWQ61_003784 [Dispira simplex]